MNGTPRRCMWAYQPHFRLSLERLAESTLAQIGAAVAPRGFLVGFATRDDVQPPVCVEPENGPFEQAQLGGVLQDAEHRHRAHEHTSLGRAEASAHEAVPGGPRDRYLVEALAAALTARSRGRARRFFVGPGSVVGAYRVHPVVGVLAAGWDALPALAVSRRHHTDVHLSLQQATVQRVLYRAARALDSQSPPLSILGDTMDDAASTVRAAASDFVYGVVVRSGNVHAHGCRELFDAVAAQPYEGRAGVGSVLLARRQHPDVDVRVAFERTVPMENARAFRKVLEMSGPDLRLLSDGERIYGLGQVRDSYKHQQEECFVATIVGRGSWELTHVGTPLLRVDNGLARLPRERITQSRFNDTLSRLFPKANADAARLWEIAQACSAQAHGTMLVVHPNAAEEGRRLVPQAITISPTYLSKDALLAMTSIDGAVLVSPDGMCHALGVILDGSATGTGEAARGARYNSAVRYLAGVGRGSLIIIVSRDGMIDLLPDLRRRAGHREVQAAVDRLVAASRGDVDYEDFYRRDRQVEALEFYLNQEQSEAVNAARHRVEDRRWNEAAQHTGASMLAPNPSEA